MEAPSVKDVQQKYIEFKYKNEKYGLTLLCSLNLKISINCLEKRQLYENEFSLEEINKINKYFLICESIKDAYEEISSYINEETKIDYGDNSVTLKIFLPCKKNREVDFNLNLIKMSLEEEVNYLNKKLFAQEKIINEQNIRLANQENDIKLLKERTYILENKISLFEDMINKKEDKDKTVQKLEKIIGRECNLKLIYQMTKD